MRMLASELRLRGLEVVTTREPGGTPLGTRVRKLLLDTEEQVDPLAELLLYAADPAPHVRTRAARPHARSARPRLRPHCPLRPLRRRDRRLPGRGPRLPLRTHLRADRARHRRTDARPDAPLRPHR